MPKFLDVPSWYGSNGELLQVWTTKGSSGLFFFFCYIPTWGQIQRFQSFVHLKLEGTTRNSYVECYVFLFNVPSSAEDIWDSLWFTYCTGRRTDNFLFPVFPIGMFTGTGGSQGAPSRGEYKYSSTGSQYVFTGEEHYVLSASQSPNPISVTVDADDLSKDYGSIIYPLHSYNL